MLSSERFLTNKFLLISRLPTQEETILFRRFLPKLEPVNMFPEQSLSIWNLQLLVKSFSKFAYLPTSVFHVLLYLFKVSTS